MRLITAAAALTACSSVAFAGIVIPVPTPSPFTETFDTDNAGWSGPAGDGTPAGFAGGALTETVNTGNFAGFPGSPTFGTVFRGSDSASGGAFDGDYAAGDINRLSFDVTTTAPIAFFVRFTSFNNAFGLTTGNSDLVFPGPFSTNVSFDIDLASLSLSGPPGGNAADIYANIRRVQILAVAIPGVTPENADVTLTIDNVSIVPAPGAAAMLGLAGIAGLRRRR